MAVAVRWARSGQSGRIAGPVLRLIYGNANRIVQAPGAIAMSYGMLHDTRVFYTDGRPRIDE